MALSERRHNVIVPVAPDPADAIRDRASIHDRPKTIEGRGEAGQGGDLIQLQNALACPSFFVRAQLHADRAKTHPEWIPSRH